MKVCVITGTLPPAKCGVGDYSEALYTGLIKKHDIDIEILTSKGNKYPKAKLNIHDVIEKWDFSSLKKILNYIKKINPDLVHIQYPTAAYGKNIFINILPMILRMKGYKVISTIHEYSDNSRLGKIRIWPNIIFSNALVVVDNQYSKDIRKKYIFRNKCIRFIGIGSNIPKANMNKEERSEIRRKIIKDKPLKIMCYFGFIHEKKGIEYILYSIKELKDKGMLSTKFLIIGELNIENQYHNSIINLIEELMLKDDIFITGYLRKEEVAKYLSASDFAIFPFVEGLSYKNGSLLAAYQEKLPTITTKPKDAVEFDNVYYINEYDNIHQISSYILTLQSNCNRDNKTNAKSSLSVDWDSIYDEHFKLYKHIINGSDIK